MSPSPAMAKFCWYLGLRPEEVAARVRRGHLDAIGESGDIRPVQMALTMAVLIISVVVSGLVVADVVNGGSWKKLALLLPVWWGHPQFSGGTGLVIAGILAALVSPLAGVVHAAGAALEIPWAKSERKTAWARFGVRLTLRQHRRMLHRSNSSTLRLQLSRQLALAQWRTRRL